VAVEAASLLEAPPDRSPLIPKTLRQRVGRVPGLEEHVCRATAPAVAGITQPLPGQRRRGRAPCAPASPAHRPPQGPIRPHAWDQRAAVHGAALLAGEHPRQARPRGCAGRGNDRVVEAQVAAGPDERQATGALQAWVPRPVGVPHARQTVMRHRLQGRAHGHAGGRRASIEPGGEVEPQQRWQRVPSFITVAGVLSAISSPVRTPRLHRECGRL
jgi:hypothetical protein